MNVILDTNAFLWLAGDRTKLSTKAKDLFNNTNASLFLSIASPWEMAIKSQSGKLILPEPVGTLVPKQLSVNGIKILPVRLEYISIIETLRTIHRDPFDRIIIATALTKKYAVMSSDAVFDEYGVSRIW
jgi:PIN domain nuclease of toxin-antitoxin system